MSATRYLDSLELERRAIEAIEPRTAAERAEWWGRLAEWWHRRDIGFGDGAGMKAHCLAMAAKNQAECA